MTDNFDRLPRRVQAVIERMRSGQRLCKSLRHKETGDSEILFFFEPSGKRAGPKSADAATKTAFVRPLGDGLFNPPTSQTWEAAP